MDDVSPLDALVGLGLLGFGVLLGYTTWKQTPGGAIGAIKSALSTGHLINGVTLQHSAPVPANTPGVHTAGNPGQPANARLG